MVRSAGIWPLFAACADEPVSDTGGGAASAQISRYAEQEIDMALFGREETVRRSGFWGTYTRATTIGGEDWNTLGPSAYTPEQMVKILSFPKLMISDVQVASAHFVLRQALAGGAWRIRPQDFPSDLLRAAALVVYFDQFDDSRRGGAPSDAQTTAKSQANFLFRQNAFTVRADDVLPYLFPRFNYYCTLDQAKALIEGDLAREFGLDANQVFNDFEHIEKENDEAPNCGCGPQQCNVQ